MQITLSPFQAEVRMMTFHPDDVPTFEAFEALDLLREVLVDDHGWEALGTHTIRWGDSGTPTRWILNVGPFNSITIDVMEGDTRISRTQFEGAWREITRRALIFLADNQS